MKFNNVLALGSLLAMAGSALAVPVPEAAVRVVTVTRVKVMGITRTKYVPPATNAVTTTSSVVTTTTTSSSSVEETSTSTSTSSSSTSSAEEEKEEETSTTETPTPTPTPEPETTTTEEKKETPTPKPAPPPQELEELEDIKEEKPEEKPKPVEKPVETTPPPASDAKAFRGEATYFDPGMGSCGETHGPNDLIAAISFQVMDPQNPGNPNNNPLCGRKIQCMRNGDPLTKTIVTVVDRCPVCVAGDLDLSPAAYKALGGTIEEGRFHIDCVWL